MINVEEHVYCDDPKFGHPDVRTRLCWANYFFLGNGLIEAAVQHAPAGEGSSYGLLLMAPEKLGMKRESLSFDAEAGLEPTMLSLRDEAGGHLLKREGLQIAWDGQLVIPCVRITWQAGPLQIRELLYCPDRSTACLARRVRLHNPASHPLQVTLATGTGSQSHEESIHIPAHSPAEICLTYSLNAGTSAIEIASCTAPPFVEAGQYWQDVSQVRLEHPVIDHLFRSAARQLPAMISQKGRIDASIWQYRREWVRDQSFAVHSVLLAGHHQTAKVMLERLLHEFVSDTGSTVDSSEVRDPDEAELDQNGILLHVLREYVLWTGDLGIVRSHWDRIVKTAEFPLQPIFREPVSGLPINQRDFWERHSAFGMEPGMELTHAVFVSLGLTAVAELARQIGRHEEASRWEQEAARLKETVLRHPTHAFVGEHGFFKRRGRNGAMQACIIPAPNSGLPHGVGLARNVPHPLNPDSSCALPIVYGFIPAESGIARRTLAQLEGLWNQAWEGGGYGRYHMDSDPDSAGPWPFPSLYIARAYLEGREYGKVQRVLDWLASLPEYPSGSFFEMYGDRIAPPYAQNGIVPWNWAEIIMLVVKNILGFQPEPDAMRIRPRLLPGMPRAEGCIPFRNGRIAFRFTQDWQIEKPQFQVDSRPAEADGDAVIVPFSGGEVRVTGTIPTV
jgi:hypothetical protein